MASITISDFLELDSYTKKYAIKVFISSRKEDGSYICKDETACASLTIGNGAEDSNKMIAVGFYMRLVNPKKIGENAIEMQKKSSSSITRQFSLGSNLSPVKEEATEEASNPSAEKEENISDLLMAPLLKAVPNQVYCI